MIAMIDLLNCGLPIFVGCADGFYTKGKRNDSYDGELKSKIINGR